MRVQKTNPHAHPNAPLPPRRTRAHRLGRLEERGHLALVLVPGAVQGGLPIIVLRVEVGAPLDQKIGDFQAARESRIVQRSITKLRSRSGVLAYAAKRVREGGLTERVKD